MNAQLEQRTWFNDILANGAASVSASTVPWINDARTEARQAVNELALPARKQEAWRYSDLSRLYKHHFLDTGRPVLRDSDVEQWVYGRADSHRLVFANGHFVADMSTNHALRHGVTIGSLKDRLASDPERVTRWLSLHAWQKPDVFSELNRAFIDDGALIHIDTNVVLDKPVEIVYLNTSSEQDALAQPHTLVILESGSQATVVERYAGSGKTRYFFNGVTAVSLGEKAKLQHHRLQHESADAHHLSRLGLYQEAASEYHGVNIATGGAWSRSDIHARFGGHHAVCNLDGLYTTGENQYTDFHLDVVHGLPHCRSRENFKGIVYGKGRAVFDGRILVEKDAQKTDAQLSNKNLLLTPFAEVDTKPQLEIHADDVRCSHGTTVGRLDSNQLFYLRSRGIDEQEARKMICLGFAAQVLAHVEDEAVRNFIHDQVAELFKQEAVLA